jgi:uncharacterized protein YerC
MRHIPNKKISQALARRSLEVATREIRKVNVPEDFLAFLRKYFTDKEMDSIMRRVAVGILLENGESYRKIRDSLEVSQGTISRVRDLLKGRGYGRNPNRKRKYSPLRNFKKKEKKFFRPYKGAESII